MLYSGSSGFLRNSKATRMVITSEKNSLSKTWWDMATAGSRQWRNSTFGEELFRDSIIKICSSNSEAWFKVLVNAQYSFLSTKRCPFTFLLAFEGHLCCIYFCRHPIRSVISRIFLWPVPIVPVAISPLYEAFAESIRRGQYIVHTSNKRPGQTATGQPHIPWIVRNVEYWACGASTFVQKILFFLDNPNGSRS